MSNSNPEQQNKGNAFEEKRTIRGAASSGRAQGPVVRAPMTGVRLLELLLDPFVAMLTLQWLALGFEGQLGTSYLVLAAVAFLVTYLVFKEFNVCRSWRFGGVTAQSRDTLIAWTLVCGILLFLGFFTHTTDIFSRTVLLTWSVGTPALLILAHAGARSLLFKLGESQRFSRSVVIVGVTELGQRLARELDSDLRLNMSFEGFFDDRDPSGANKVANDKFLGALSALPAYVKKHGIDVIYITLPVAQQKRILQLLDSLRDTTASIYFTPDYFMHDLIQARMDEVNGIPVVAVCETPFYGINALLKRVSDIFISVTALLSLAPLLLVIALLIKFTSRGPVIFKQKRYGLDGEEIRVYKFRSMRVMDNGDVVKQATKEDPRVTTVGKYLRRYSLDELPQFFNVLQGRMSVVGPRPHAVAHNELYRGMIKGYMVRHKVKPGITGWAQVNGLRGETDTVEKMKARIDYDLDYLRNWSVWLDIKIILLTIRTAFGDQNAY